MDSDKKICPYCGEEIMAAAKKCKHCGEWLDQTPTEPASEVTSKKSIKTESPKSTRETVLNLAIALLVVANLTVVFFWIKACMNPTSVMQQDMAKTSSLMNKKDLSDRTDSISYALGCWTIESGDNAAKSQFRMNDEQTRLKTYAGMLRGLISPNSEKRIEGISTGIQAAWDIQLETKSKVGKLDRDAIFQGVVDVNTTGRNQLLSPDEFGAAYHSYFNF